MNDLTEDQKTYIAGLVRSGYDSGQRTKDSLLALEVAGFLPSRHDSRNLSPGSKTGEVLSEGSSKGHCAWVWDGDKWVSMFRPWNV